MSQRGWNRRELIRIGGLAGTGAAIGLGSPVWAKPPQVPRKVLGKTGQRVPILMMGGSMPLDIAFDTKFAEGFRHGVDYFDTSRTYVGGNGEVALANFHTRMKCRDRMWITTKSKAHDPEGMARSLAVSLERLKTDHVEMLFLHGLADPRHLDAAMAKRVAGLKRAGKIRHFGFSTHANNVVELLERAAQTPWVEVVMFRYNFRKYGDVALNRAIDRAAKANVGLIAMKTQGAEVSLQDKWQKIAKGGRWNKYQAVLKAVWSDDRLTGLVSEMDTLQKVRENVQAALDDKELGAVERADLERYAAVTRNQACHGCDHLCGGAAPASVRIADTLRFLSYAEVYGKPEAARRLFSALPAEARRLDGVDFTAAARACPEGLDLVQLMARAQRTLA